MRAQEEAAARTRCRRWGCGTGRDTDDPLLRTVAESFVEFAGVAEPARAPRRCPFEGVFRGDGWVQELQAARVLVSDQGYTWPDALGRPLTAVDRDATLVMLRAEGRLDRLRREQDEAERKRREAERGTR